MSEATNLTCRTACPQCSRKIMQNISNRCMYCGADLPEEHQLSQQEKSAFLVEKLDRMKQVEDNAEEVISNLRKDFAIPEKKKARKSGNKNSEAAIAAAIAGINTQSNSSGGNIGGNSGGSS